MKKNIFKIKFLATGMIGLFLILAPSVLFAASDLVPDCSTKIDLVTNKFIPHECGFSDLMVLAYNVVHFLIFTLFLPIAAILFAYAGFLFMTAGGSEENVGKARKIFGHVAIGLVVMLCAWLIVKLVLIGLGVQDGFSLLNNVGK